MIAGAARRFAILFLGASCGSAFLGALVGLVGGFSAQRGAALGLYVAGALSALIGAALGVRNSIQMRTASGEPANEVELAGVDRELAGLLVVLGVLLIVLGVAVDPGARLV